MNGLRFKNVSLIFRKEMLDLLRDKRTVISMLVAPLLLYPLMIIGVGAIAKSQMEKLEEKDLNIFVVGSQNAPVVFESIKEIDKMVVEPMDNLEQVKPLIINGDVDAIVVIPENLLAEGDEPVAVTILYNESKEESGIATKRIKKKLGELRDTISESRLAAMNTPVTVAIPFEWESENVATSEQMTGIVFGSFMPYMMILLTLGGAIYPAIDLTAGEKERSTLETILASAATRLEIVIGKYITVMAASLITATVTIVAMSLEATMGIAAIGGAAGEGLGFDFSISPLSVILAICMMVPLSAFFAAALITIAIFAKSQKEAQSYLTPIMFLVIVPAMMSMMPGADTGMKQAWIPIVNVSLVMKDILSGSTDMVMLGNTILSTAIYAIAAIFVTVRVFQREDVLFKI